MGAKRLQVAVGAVVLALASWLVLSRSPGASVPGPGEPGEPTRRVLLGGADAPSPVPGVEGEVPPAASAGQAAAAHADIASALGLVAIRCHVGAELDTRDLVGPFSQRIERGWYSNVVLALEGTQEVIRRFRRDGSVDPLDEEYETIFFVRWKADAPGTTVPCEVTWPKYAELRVKVADAAGTPLSGARVFGCGKVGESDATGSVLLEVFAERDCALHGYTPFEPGSTRTVMLFGEAELPALAEHEVRALDLTLTEVEPGDTPGPPPPGELLIPYPPSEAQLASEIQVYERLRAASSDPAQAELYDELIGHRAEMIERLAENARHFAEAEARLEEFRALIEGVEAGEASVEDVLEASQRILDATNTLLENK